MYVHDLTWFLKFTFCRISFNPESGRAVELMSQMYQDLDSSNYEGTSFARAEVAQRSVEDFQGMLETSGFISSIAGILVAQAWLPRTVHRAMFVLPRWGF